MIDLYLSNFVSMKWKEVNNLLGWQYPVNENIQFKKIQLLRSDLCDYSDAYIVVKGRTNVTTTNNAKRMNKKPFFNNVPFRWCMTKVNNTFIDHAENLGIVLPKYKLLEY